MRNLWVVCNTCRESFEAETHAGLVRCGPCEERTAFRLPGSHPAVVQVAAEGGP